MVLGGGEANYQEQQQELDYQDSEYYVRLLQTNGIPNGCSLVAEGISDDKCKEVSDGKFSYKCALNDQYLCCKKKQGLNIQTGDGVAGRCQRNKAEDEDNDPAPDEDNNTDPDEDNITDPVSPPGDIDNTLVVDFDSAIHTVDTSVLKVNCVRYNIVPPPETKCLRITVTLSGPDEEDLVVFEDTIKESLESGTYEALLIENGLPPSSTVVINETSSPTQPPTREPTTSPSAAPSISGDPCPDFNGDCKGCVTNENCLFCLGNEICFNTNPDKRGGGTGEELTRWLEEELECEGTVTVSSIVCTVPQPVPTFLVPTSPRSPTMSPTASENPTSNPTERVEPTTSQPTTKSDDPNDPDGSGSISALSKSNTWISCLLVSAIFALMH